MSTSKPIVIVGGGVYGTALAMMLGRKLRQNKSDQKVILVERHESPNTMGSSHGDSRISRFANAEAAFLSKTAIASVKEYSDLQKQFWFSSDAFYMQLANELRTKFGSERLFQKNGLLMMAPEGEFGRKAHNVSNFIDATIKNAQESGIAHEVIDGVEAMERFPGYKIANDDINNTKAYYEPDSGTLFPERCVYAQLRMAQHYGVEYRPHVEMKSFQRTGDGVDVTFADDSNISASKLVLATGAWINQFLPPSLNGYFRIQRQVVGWFHVDKPELITAPQAPNHIIFQRTEDGDINYHYGFPINPYSQYPNMVKTASEIGANIGDPAPAVLRDWHEAELDTIFNFAAGFICGLQRDNALGESCRYTNEREGRLIAAPYPADSIKEFRAPPQAQMPLLLPRDELKASDDIVVLSACSGHGFKNAIGLTDAVASRMLDQKPEHDVDLKDYAWAKPEPVPTSEADASLMDLLKQLDQRVEKTAQISPGGPKII